MDRLQEVIDRAWEGTKEWSATEREDYLASLRQQDHPLFLDDADVTASPFDDDDYETPDAAMGDALASKERGAASFRKGPEYFANALRHWRTSLQQSRHAPEGEERAALESAVHGNMAAVFLARRQFSAALGAAEEAVACDGSNVKGWWRRAQACLELGYWTRAEEACEGGLTLLRARRAGTADAPVTAEERAFETALREAQAGKARVERERRRVLEERAARVRTLDAVRAVVRERGLLVGPPLLGDDAASMGAAGAAGGGGAVSASAASAASAEPFVDEEGAVHWPVYIVFPDVQVVELVREVSELASVEDIVAIPLASHPPWGRGLFAASAAAPSSPPPLIYYQTFLTPPRDVDRAWRQPWEPQFQPARDAVEEAEGDADASRAGDAWRWDLERKHASRSGRASRVPRWVCVPPHTPLLFLMVQADFVAADVPILYVRPHDRPITDDVRTLVVPDLADMQAAAAE